MNTTDPQIKGLNILLGVTGGVAAYKAADLASRLTAAGAIVNCILTENACKLICPKSFEAVTGRAVYVNLWSNPSQYSINHISLAESADIVIVAPATANIIAKTALGICDDLLSTTLCACWNKPLIFAPAMNNNMWSNPAVGKNVETLKNRGIILVGPDTGRLACGSQGTGRMAEPADILKAAEQAAAGLKK